jgi:hypothetical protein
MGDRRISKELEPITAPALMAKKYPRRQYVYRPVLPVGLVLLAGPPKSGKSWLAFDAACGLNSATSEWIGYRPECPEEPKSALVLDLENDRTDTQERLRLMHPDGEVDDQLVVSNVCPRLDKGGLIELAAYLERMPHTRLIVIDTIAKLWPSSVKAGNAYYAESEILEDLQDIAKGHNCCVLIVHHTNLEIDHNNPFVAISGTQAMRGVPDANLVLRRKHGENIASLYVEGRKVPVSRRNLDWDIASWRWRHHESD